MRKHIVLTAAIGLLALSGAAQAGVKLTVKPSGYAARTCFTKADAEAEQAIRIRSELMVIGLNCQNSRYRETDENLYRIYRQFTADHGPLFAAYEKQMLNYYKRAGAPDPNAALNELGTSFGNKIALDVARMRPDMFCYRYAPRMQKIKTMSNAQVRQWAATAYADHPPSRPLCR
jgi:hypothetical protein